MITVKVSDQEAGRVRVNAVYPYSYPFKGTYFEEVPIRLEAEPAPGFAFSHWEGSVESQNRLVDYSSARGGTFRAVFEQVADPEAEIVINEINYHSASHHQTGDWVELFNNGNVPVNLSGWVLSDNDFSTGYVIRDTPVLAPGEFLVVTRTQRDFRNYYPNESAVQGDLVFGLAREGDVVLLYESDGDRKSVV